MVDAVGSVLEAKVYIETSSRYRLVVLYLTAALEPIGVESRPISPQSGGRNSTPCGPVYGRSPHLGLAKVTRSGASLKQRSSSSLLKTGWFAAK